MSRSDKGMKKDGGQSMKMIRRITTLILAMVLLVSCLSIPAFAAGSTMYGIGFVTATSLRLRSEASSGSAILATAPQNDCVVVISKTGEWYKVNYNLQEGYMHEAYLSVSSRENAELGYGKITGSSVNLRTGPATTYSIAAVSSQGEKCYIVGLNNGWYKVIYKDKLAYIRSDYVQLTEKPYENKASANSPKFYRLGKSTGIFPSAAALTGSSTASAPKENTAPAVTTVSGSQILTEAQKYLGVRYISGGASPSGFDCAGLVYYVLKQLGYAPYRTPVDQYRHGTYVNKADLKAGDIVFFAGTGASGISHVGIYAGNGQFLHAPNSRSVVSYSDLTTGYWANHYYGARRIG